ncbi:GIY-YIG nuclease family protein [Belliella sp. R4-6]|uniref:GIY-YIG nuclease family protein n=1 Tax=Belliella alkalica TaxID=1730871 RepID=A0ABS9VD69_9BACT|nr:GIY-YIG nuclease family protein [Belliella alkalica]MCH7414378.1 GIY-YIG nuclease family protein [Belliella alkalica]
MASFFYIIHSKKLNRFYSGVTSVSVQERLDNHINKVYSKKHDRKITSVIDRNYQERYTVLKHHFLLQ